MSSAWAGSPAAKPGQYRRASSRLRSDWVAVTMRHLRSGRPRVAMSVVKLGVEEQARVAGLGDVRLPMHPERLIPASADLWARRTWAAIADRHGLTGRS